MKLWFLLILLLPVVINAYELNLEKAELLNAGTFCSCILGLRSFGVNLPPPPVDAEDIIPNSMPFRGSIALLSYDLEHVALIVDFDHIGFWVQETNYKPCKYSERFIRWDSSELRGFAYFPA